MINSTITTADVAIFSGNRSGDDYDARYVGGIVLAYESHFKYNYVDIMFSPWSIGGICFCADPDGEKWQSEITHNVFDTLATDYYCEPFVDSVLARIERFYFSGTPPTLCPPPQQNIWELSGFPSTPSRCHLVDLSPFIEYDINRTGIMTCNDACLKNGWSSADPAFDPPNQDITKGNTYINNCKINYNNNKFD